MCYKKYNEIAQFSSLPVSAVSALNTSDVWVFTTLFLALH